jgi:sulfatase maturation enzyme AslB (radical SAM superfamily)
MSTPAPREAVHDFSRKLRQPSLYGRVVDYVAWQRDVRAARARGEAGPAMPDWAPLSINLDLTTACNYACDHCIDLEILNSGIAYEEQALRASLKEMAARGLKSVILIGGGEPTIYPGFPAFARYLKDLGLAVAVVSNGSRNDKILEAATRFDAGDWVRLSLDAGTDATFQRMHKPKKPVSLDHICAGITKIKAANPAPRLGFSYIITWKGATSRGADDTIVENLDEIPLAARRARDAGFDYISFKPFLTRREDGAEVMDPAQAEAETAAIVARIRGRLDEAKAFASPTFNVLESANLKMLEAGSWRAWTQQPKMCHMQALRQVLTPLGLYNCPAHRGVPKARIGEKDAYASPAACHTTAAGTAGILDRFDASVECREVTCLYHDTNWWLEEAIEGQGLARSDAVPEGGDWFL